MIHCVSCGASNQEGSRFCNECGQTMSVGVVCPSCGLPNLPEARFCNRCGARCTGGITPPAVAKPVDDLAPVQQAPAASDPGVNLPVGASPAAVDLSSGSRLELLAAIADPQPATLTVSVEAPLPAPAAVEAAVAPAPAEAQDQPLAVPDHDPLDRAEITMATSLRGAHRRRADESVDGMYRQAGDVFASVVKSPQSAQVVTLERPVSRRGPVLAVVAVGLAFVGVMALPQLSHTYLLLDAWLKLIVR